ncbi:MAG: LPS-assembly protein LptD [Geminicoccaceae bacterium]
MPMARGARRRGRAKLLLVAGLCLAAPGHAQQSSFDDVDLGDDDAPVVLTANSMAFDQVANEVVAEGEVELTRGMRQLRADRLVYDLDSEEVTAFGNVVLIDDTGTALFADQIALGDDLRDGAAEKLGLLTSDDSRVAAARGRRVNGNQTIMEEVVYSPCPVCRESERDPAWQIRAGEVVHDELEQEVRYKNATFEAAGVPIFYLPRFSHPDPSVERKSGLLVPTLRDDSTLGFVFETPYYFALAPDRDFTFEPIVTTREGVVVGGNYRQLTRTGQFNIRANGTYTTEFAETSEEADEQEFRGSIEGKGRFTTDSDWRWGYDLARTTDPTYLQRYDFSNSNVLTSRLFTTHVWNDANNFAEVEGITYQDLRDGADSGLTPIITPFANVHASEDTGYLGSRWTLDGNVLGLTRLDGRDTRRLVVAGGIDLPMRGGLGDLIDVRAELRGDVYNFNGDAQDIATSGEENFEARLVPRLSAQWRWPLVRDDSVYGFRPVLEPIVAATIAPTDYNNGDVPNEDSQDLEFDDTNLFEPVRYTGFDLVDGGAKVAYGLKFGGYHRRGGRITGLIGQSLQLSDNDYPAGTGLEDDVSDLVGRLVVNPHPLLDISYRFRFDMEDLEAPRNEVLAEFGPPPLRFELGYLGLDDSLRENVDTEGEREELTAGAFIGITPEVGVSGRLRRDLTNDEAITSSLGLVYNHPCYTLALGFQRDFRRNRDIPPRTVVAARITLKTLGEIGGSTSLIGGGG